MKFANFRRFFACSLGFFLFGEAAGSSYLCEEDYKRIKGPSRFILVPVDDPSDSEASSSSDFEVSSSSDFEVSSSSDFEASSSSDFEASSSSDFEASSSSDFEVSSSSDFEVSSSSDFEVSSDDDIEEKLSALDQRYAKNSRFSRKAWRIFYSHSDDRWQDFFSRISYFLETYTDYEMFPSEEIDALSIISAFQSKMKQTALDLDLAIEDDEDVMIYTYEDGSYSICYLGSILANPQAAFDRMNRYIELLEYASHTIRFSTDKAASSYDSFHIHQASKRKHQKKRLMKLRLARNRYDMKQFEKHQKEIRNQIIKAKQKALGLREELSDDTSVKKVLEPKPKTLSQTSQKAIHQDSRIRASLREQTKNSLSKRIRAAQPNEMVQWIAAKGMNRRYKLPAFDSVIVPWIAFMFSK